MAKFPKGWLDYSPIGERIAGTRFICFKVPLEVDQQEVAEENRLSPALLMERIPELGLIIDLTDTDRYYDPREFVRNGVSYQKIRIQGHILPRNSMHNIFRRVVNEYLSDSSNSDKLIGVHCTHGCNRTGLMVCSYLIKDRKMSAKDAIQVFQVGRGHEMHRENYLEAIYKTTSSRSSTPSIAQHRMQTKLRNIPIPHLTTTAALFGSQPCHSPSGNLSYQRNPNQSFVAGATAAAQLLPFNNSTSGDQAANTSSDRSNSSVGAGIAAAAAAQLLPFRGDSGSQSTRSSKQQQPPAASPANWRDAPQNSSNKQNPKNRPHQSDRFGNKKKPNASTTTNWRDGPRK